MSAFAALFAGTASTQAADTQAKWKQMFLSQQQIDQQRAAMEEQARQFNQQMSATEQRAFDEREFQVKLEQMRQDFTAGQADTKATIDLATTVLQAGIDGKLSNDQLMSFAEEISVMPYAAPYAPLIKSTVQRSMFDNPQQAQTVLEQVSAAGLNEPIPSKALFQQALQVALNFVPEADRKSTEAYYLDMYDKKSANIEFVTNAGLEAITLGNLQGQANLQQTVKQTESIVAGIDLTKVQIAQGEYDLANNAPIATKLLEGQLKNQTLVNSDLEIRLDSLPHTLALEIAAKEMNVQQMTDTYDAVVSTVLAQARAANLSNDVTEAQLELLGSEVRVQLATEGARIAIQEGNLDLLNANIEQINTSIAVGRDSLLTSKQDRELKNQQAEVFRQDAELRVASLLADMFAQGQIEMIDSVGPKLLRQLGITNPGATIDAMRERVDGLRTKEEIQDELNFALLTAQTDLARWQADVAQEQWEFEEWLKREGVAINWEQIKVQREQIASNESINFAKLQAASVGGGGGGGGVGAPSGVGVGDILSAIGLAGTNNLQNWNEMVSKFSEDILGQLNYNDLDSQEYINAKGSSAYTSLVDNIRRYMIAAQSVGANPMPPGIDPDSNPFHYDLVMSTGLFSQGGAGADRQVVPANTRNVALNVGGDSNHLITLWNAMAPEEQAVFGDFATYSDDVQAEVTQVNAQRVERDRLFSTLSTLSQNEYVRNWTGGPITAQNLYNFQEVVNQQIPSMERALESVRVHIGTMQSDPGSVAASNALSQIQALAQAYNITIPMSNLGFVTGNKPDVAQFQQGIEARLALLRHTSGQASQLMRLIAETGGN